MTFPQAVRAVLSNYATFSGRARRSEFWWFYLFTVLVGLASSVVDAALNIPFQNEIGIVGMVTSLAFLIPSLAVTARRLHDTGRTGWWMLLPVGPLLGIMVTSVASIFAIVLIAFEAEHTAAPAADQAPRLGGVMVVLLLVFALLTIAAFITLLVFLCLDSDPGPNKYGTSPKQPVPPGWPGGYYPPAGYGHPYGYPPQS
jgi:uncharacterized membrane protein YhaH (DUF805 family)